MADRESQRLVHRALLGEAIDSLTDAAVFVWGDDRRYVAVNETACVLTGLTRDELVGMPVGDLSPDGAAGDMARAKAGGIVQGSSSFTRRDGEVVALNWVTMQTRVAGLPYLVSLCWRA